MEDLLSGDMAIGIAGAIVGALTMGILFGAKYLIKSFKISSNKLDDELIPLLERLVEATEKK